MCISEQRYSIEKKVKIVYTKQIMNNLMLSVDGIPSEDGIFSGGFAGSEKFTGRH